MQRIESTARPGWQGKLESVGLTYHSNGQEPAHGADGGLWWHEASYWKLTSAEVDALDDATAELHARCLDAVDHIVTKEPALLRDAFAFPEWFARYAETSWRRSDPAFLGRMDLAFDDASGAIKLLEYNADTPTLAIETAVAQWMWLQDTHPAADQFNSLHEKILGRWKELAALMEGKPMHFMGFPESEEDWAHSTYYRDLAEQAGIKTIAIDINEVGWNGTHFVGEAMERIDFIHKMCPWEWLRNDDFGPHLTTDTCGILEPPWKAILSDKAILPVLWKLFPNHPNLLECVMGRQELDGGYVQKPCLGREGSNVSVVRPGLATASTDGPYGHHGARFVTQALAKLPSQSGWSAVLGSWMVGDQTAGLIIRESQQAIVRDNSRVVPHLFT